MSADLTDALAYARRRVQETGRAYLVTGMGHVWVADAHNTRSADDDVGGIACIIRPRDISRQSRIRPCPGKSGTYAPSAGKCHSR